MRAALRASGLMVGAGATTGSRLLQLSASILMRPLRKVP